ncbi:hypothetical protein QQP08_027639 [Theobroma cacao]|nr:hypothetical protein QQP08_027639 [Theobroma cacao]
MSNDHEQNKGKLINEGSAFGRNVIHDEYPKEQENMEKRENVGPDLVEARYPKPTGKLDRETFVSRNSFIIADEQEESVSLFHSSNPSISFWMRISSRFFLVAASVVVEETSHGCLN